MFRSLCLPSVHPSSVPRLHPTDPPRPPRLTGRRSAPFATPPVPTPHPQRVPKYPCRREKTLTREGEPSHRDPWTHGAGLGVRLFRRRGYGRFSGLRSIQENVGGHRLDGEGRSPGGEGGRTTQTGTHPHEAPGRGRRNFRRCDWYIRHIGQFKNSKCDKSRSFSQK